MSWLTFHFQDFSYSFLSILFEGIPFLLLGSLVSGLVDAFVPSETLTKILPKNGVLAICLSGLLGGIFPMCECGSVIMIRRFIKKGLPVSAAITYMLASPIVNPIVALSTFTAFRSQSPWLMMSLRVLIGYLIAVAGGLIARKVQVDKLLQPAILATLKGPKRTAFKFSASPDMVEDIDMGVGATNGFRTKVMRAAQSATSDFLDVAFFLVIGAAIASVFNTSVNQSIIQPLAGSTLLSIIAMMGLRFILALCSTSDAFIAASFVSFPYVSKLAFLVFGAMFDIKLLFLYQLVFRRRFVLFLGIGLSITVVLICFYISTLHALHL
ncbi:MAG: permease [Chthoniobacteraceae bacterium]